TYASSPGSASSPTIAPSTRTDADTTRCTTALTGDRIAVRRARGVWQHAAMPDPLLITVAPTGAETAKEDCPQLPTTLEELVATAKECEAAGAAMIHVHIRDAAHRPTLDLGRLRDTVAALREGTDLVVQLSTGGSVHDPLDLRLKVLDAEPDSCSLTM